MRKHSAWPKASLAMAFLALILAIVALVRTVPQPAAPSSTSLTPVNAHATNDVAPRGESFYYNEDLGIFFANPFGYEVSEEYIPYPSDSSALHVGKAAIINVRDPQSDFSMNITFATSDYGATEYEGCCYFFNGTLDPTTMSINDITSVIGESFRNVLFPELTEVGGKDAARFTYDTFYVSTSMNEAVIVPLTGREYDHVFMHSRYNTEYEIDLAGDELTTHLEQHAAEWRDLSTLTAFNTMLQSIIWTK